MSDDDVTTGDLALFWQGEKPKLSDARGFRTYQVAKSHASKMKYARKDVERATRNGDPAVAWAAFERKRQEIIASFEAEKATIDTKVDVREVKTAQRQAEEVQAQAARQARQQDATAAKKQAEEARAADRAAKAKKRREREEAGAPRRLYFEGQRFGINLSVERDRVSVPGQVSGPFSGSVMRVETSGQINRRVTATRIVALGVFAFAAKKKQDDRELFITIEGDGFQIAVSADPERQAAARQFAARYNTMAARAVRPALAALTSPTDAVPAIPPARPAPDLVSQLAQLAALRDSGALTDAEFSAAKAQAVGLQEPQDETPRAW